MSDCRRWSQSLPINGGVVRQFSGICTASRGNPIRATISDMGPVLLSRLMGLNETQEGVLNIAFAVADDNGLLLLDLKDLRAMLQHVSRQRLQRPRAVFMVMFQKVRSVPFNDVYLYSNAVARKSFLVNRCSSSMI